jgi:hypothetical protein
MLISADRSESSLETGESRRHNPHNEVPRKIRFATSANKSAQIRVIGVLRVSLLLSGA